MARIPRLHFTEKVVRATGTFVVVLAVAVLVLCLWAVMWLANENSALEDQDRQSRADRAQLREDVDAEAAAREALEGQIRGLGEKPVVEPEDIPGDAQVVVVPGPKGDRGASCVEELGYPRCRGDEGSDGAAGARGADGSDGADGADGQPGPAGSPGPKGDKGDTGPQGERGPAGADGRGIQSVTCEGGQFVVTYTDGTSQPVAGSSCFVAPGNSGETP